MPRRRQGDVARERFRRRVSREARGTSANAPQASSMYCSSCGCGLSTAEPDGDRERAPRPQPAVANAAHEEPERQRQQRADEQLAVVARRDEARDARRSACTRCRRRATAKKPRPHARRKPYVKQPGEEDVDDEAPRHRRRRSAAAAAAGTSDRRCRRAWRRCTACRRTGTDSTAGIPCPAFSACRGELAERRSRRCTGRCAG